MAGKNSNEKHEKPLWRPLAHKLSSLLLGRRHSKLKSKADTSDLSGRCSVADFRPLEVQLNSQEGLHVPNNWLVKPANADKPKQKPSPLSADASPIAAADQDDAAQPAAPKDDQPEPEPKKRPESPHYGHVVIHQDVDREQARMSALTALTATRNSTVPSILDRGRPVEARHLVRQPTKNLKSHRKSLPLEFELLNQMSSQDPTADATRPESKLDATASTPSKPSMLDVTSKRHSMLPELTGPTRASTIRVVPAESTFKTPHPLKQNPSTLRKEITQTSPMKPPPGPTSAPSPELTSVPKLKKPAGALSDRLAWIKKLEDKDNGRKDLPPLAKRTGSVSDKLAMFEKKNLSVAPSAHLHPASRTNSSTYSAYSSVTSRDSIFSADGLSAPSPRTSVDTARTSSVMSYYDDSFREKLESLVGQEPKESETEVEDSQE